MSIVVVGAYGFSNVGDEAMLHTVLRSLDDMFPEERKTVSCVNQGQVSLLHNVETVGGLSPVAIFKNLVKLRFGEFAQQIRALRRMKILIYGGGSIFNDAKGVKTIVVILLTMMTARLCGASICLWGVGVGPATSPVGKRVIGRMLALTDIVIVRDKKSLATVKELNPASNVRQGVDLLFNHAMQDAERKAIEDRKNSDLHIGVSLRPFPAVRDFDYKRLDQMLIPALAKAIDTLQCDRKIRLHGLVYSEGGGRRDDLAMLDKLESALESVDFGQRIGGFSNRDGVSMALITSDLIDGISALDLVIGERFHSIVMATLAGTPFVALSYDQKVTELAHALGMEKYCIEVGESFDSEQFSSSVKAAVESLLDNYETEKQKLNKKLASFKHVADEDRRYISQML